MTKLRVTNRQLSELTPYARNTKEHPEDQVVRIAASIERFGFRDPIAVWHGVIVEGHGRYQAAERLGLEEVPVIELPDEMSEKDVDLYRIAHNKIALSSSFDFERLTSELRELTGGDFSLSMMGFDETVGNSFLVDVQGGTQGIPSSGGGGQTSYEVIHDDKEQRARFTAFLKSIETDGKTRTESLINKIEESGVLTNPSTAEEVKQHV